MPIFVPGGSSADTRLVQQKLNSFPGSTQPRLVEDGIFGPKTRARTIEFQKQRGLVPDGVVGIKTRAALGMSAAIPVGPTAPGQAGGGTQVVSAVVSAFTGAITTWKATAVFAGIIVNGVTAVGGPGCLVGAPLAPLMTARLTTLTGDDRAIATAAAEGIGTNFAIWQSGVTVPGLPWYPTFAAVPGPVGPPSPNIPTPLVALASSGLGLMSDPNALQAAMAKAASVSLRDRAKASFASIATQVSPKFQAMLVTSMVTGVMGTGPVPTFAPPYVPVGPVVGGRAFSPPGALV
jgi:peptidoglycan hydrolase-like protein with peptidoglycan-binding domain